MNTSSSTALKTLDRVDTAVASVTSWLDRAGHDCDAAVRDHPREAMLLAFTAGAMATRPPLNVMVGAACKTAWSVAPAVLALFGAFKLARQLGRLDDAQPRAIRPELVTRKYSPDSLPPPIKSEGALT